MADDSETAVKRPPSRPQRSSGEENDHEHCSDCENEEEHSYNRGGLSPVDDSGAKKKKKKQKRKKEKGEQLDLAQDQPVKVKLPAERIQEIQKAIELFSVGQGPAKTMEEASKRSYQFWDTQPVPKLGEVVNTHGPVEPDKDNIRQEPYTLPPGFTWDALDLGDRGVLKELYTLLNENYVEDDDNMFRFDYSPEFLLWALRPPGWLPQWHCGVRVISSKKLVGFISAIPATIHIYDSEKKMVEINFLCVHKKLRSKRVAPVLIREITRRVHLEGIFQAVYTAGVVLPKPVGTCRYWHRSLNPRKLIEVKFSHLSRNMTMQRTMKLYRLPETPKTSSLRTMEHKDLAAVHKLLAEYLKQFHLTPVMSREEVEHWFFPQENIIDTFVVESPTGEVTDFLSFYTLPSTIMNHPTHKSLKAAYSFYNVHTKTPLLDLMSDALILAKSKGFDVFNALDLMENKTFLEKLKFGIGDGNLQYYLYNWKCPSMGAEKVSASLSTGVALVGAGRGAMRVGSRLVAGMVSSKISRGTQASAVLSQITSH
ncbi:sodium- and chloride-dependent GABA transporter 2 [Platysternon megacephalum]|uniref:Glycylpeptide N-tetradecanoyltransferase n=1 Tax=Platysternon megacephalum TaxID=55544 RepID=A0A4D9DVT5_9SAUR|nr:sodium- and chloride-dependent GABA transporter 2 [Platysternon megacephalum]